MAHNLSGFRCLLLTWRRSQSRRGLYGGGCRRGGHSGPAPSPFFRASSATYLSGPRLRLGGRRLLGTPAPTGSRNLSASPSGRPDQQAAFTLSGQQRVEDRKGLAGIKEQGHQCSSQLPITSCNVLVLEMPGQLLIPYVITKEKRPSFPSLWWGPLLHAQFGLFVRSVSIEVKDVSVSPSPYIKLYDPSLSTLQISH